MVTKGYIGLPAVIKGYNGLQSGWGLKDVKKFQGRKNYKGLQRVAKGYKG